MAALTGKSSTWVVMDEWSTMPGFDLDTVSLKVFQVTHMPKLDDNTDILRIDLQVPEELQQRVGAMAKQWIEGRLAMLGVDLAAAGGSVPTKQSPPDVPEDVPGVGSW